MRVVCYSISSCFGSAVTATLPSFPSSRFPPLRPISIPFPNSPPLLLRSTPPPRPVTRMASNHAQDQQDPRLERISSAIRVIPDFPKPGILFQDITTLLLDPKAFKDTIDLFVERYRDQNINVVAGVEARGFIFGPPIALAIGAKFVPMRKPNKLPGICFLLNGYVLIIFTGEVISEEYSLEYGTDKIEMHVGAVQPGERALVIDDLIATGGTLDAAIKLLERVGVHVVECACLIELPELKVIGPAKQVDLLGLMGIKFSTKTCRRCKERGNRSNKPVHRNNRRQDQEELVRNDLNQAPAQEGLISPLYSLILEWKEAVNAEIIWTLASGPAVFTIFKGRDRLGDKPLFVLVKNLDSGTEPNPTLTSP
ncbi:unnamed protein product [Sphenostylis stenocarpa]|uniref:adenine phosphoribosyltransferase n=1 Tax=Sphenostylis stenocarpa TaxID=92480 RepID=A0AA86T306_9FABA|nr:unnamed protein product [Sphenostylis stenocarpa]